MKPHANLDPPVNPKGGETLIVDAGHPDFYPRPSAAFEVSRYDDMVFVRPGVYEDRLFITDRPIQLVGAGRDQVEIFCRRGGPLYLQQVPEGLISGITFRYIGSDKHSAMNLLNSTCNVSACRIKDGVQSGIVIYGPESRAALVDSEVCHNRESGIFVFGGARPYIRQNLCYDNHHFGIAVRDVDTCPDLVRNICRTNMLSGILMFHFAKALVLENYCHDNEGWGMVITPDCKPSPELGNLATANKLDENPRGALCETNDPLGEIGR